MKVSAKGISYQELNEKVRLSQEDVVIEDVMGERFIACGQSGKKITIHGTPGNALGAYLDGAVVEVFGNGQDAVGDTMNDGKIVVRGSVGDALGYAMRGGKIYVQGDVGYRAGVHIKEYKDKKPVIVIGGVAGSFLGEYMAGGVLVVLNLEEKDEPVGNFTGVGMHGGKIFVRGELNAVLPPQVKCEEASSGDLETIKGYLKEYSSDFSIDEKKLINSKYYVLSPDSANPYKRLYTGN